MNSNALRTGQGCGRDKPLHRDVTGFLETLSPGPRFPEAAEPQPFFNTDTYAYLHILNAVLKELAMAKTRPIGVTILAILAPPGAIDAAIHTLQMLLLLPTFIGPIAFWQFSRLGAFFWGILVLVWLAVFGMLWEVQPQGWNFLLVLGILNLVFGIISVLGGSLWESMASILIVSAVVVIYCLLPGTKQAFAIPQ